MKTYKIETYDSEYSLKNDYPELFEEGIEEIDIQKVYDIFESVLEEEDKEKFLASFEDSQGGWFLQVTRDGKEYYFWGDSPGWNNVICIYEDEHKDKILLKAQFCIQLARENYQPDPEFTEYANWEELISYLTEKECDYLEKEWSQDGACFAITLDKILQNAYKRWPGN